MAMDVKREGVAKKKMIKRIIVFSLLAVVVAGASYEISKLKPAAPSVERATVWIDQVKRGPMVVDRRGLGTLVPENIRQVPAQFDSTVSKILMHSGDVVKPDTILMVLTNPQMEVDANDLEWQIKQAEAAYQNLKVTLQSTTFDQQSTVDTVKSDMEQAELTKDKD